MKPQDQTYGVHNAGGRKPQGYSHLAELILTHGNARYEFFNTGDGSPSICLSNEIFRPEAMHHREGALSESVFIYHGLLVEALERGLKPHVLSVGTGCGYNEMISVAHFMREKTEVPANFYLETFEGEAMLRESFQKWLTLSAEQADQSLSQTSKENETDSSAAKLQHELIKNFWRVAIVVAKHFEIDAVSLKYEMKRLYENGQLVSRAWLTSETEFKKSFSVIFFDAFSRQSTPGLWSEEFLISFLHKTASIEGCGLATYAATGTLNRALAASGFARTEMPGFSGKRQSTRAWKARG